ncbi:hypothetical protein C0J52_26644 [Blattella germanica]|nr:hypothetical protein C0J52_26644 [Blattella germanica]
MWSCSCEGAGVKRSMEKLEYLDPIDVRDMWVNTVLRMVHTLFVASTLFSPFNFRYYTLKTFYHKSVHLRSCCISLPALTIDSVFNEEDAALEDEVRKSDTTCHSRSFLHDKPLATALNLRSVFLPFGLMCYMGQFSKVI